MSFSVGIVGLPNVGKSTLFQALTKKQVDISNYPFCTISPNVGVVKVPDERLDKLAEILSPKEILPTPIEFVDIAGLVRGAHKGEGLGNQFLAQIREVDAICHLLREFQDPNITPISGKIDPKSDQEVVNLELVFADLATVEKRLKDLEKKAKAGLDKIEAKTLEVVKKMKARLDGGGLASQLDLSKEEKLLIRDLNLLTLKPILYVLNIGEKQLQATTHPENWVRGYKLQAKTIPISCKLEMELAELPGEEAKEYLKEYGLEKSGLDQLISASYQLLDLITFFTCQNQILQAWTVRSGAKAPEAAGKIHTDFAKGFIRAEVINWKDLVKYGTEQKAREKGLMRTEGKDYIVKDGDVIHFKFAA